MAVFVVLQLALINHAVARALGLARAARVNAWAGAVATALVAGGVGLEALALPLAATAWVSVEALRKPRPPLPTRFVVPLGPPPRLGAWLDARLLVAAAVAIAGSSVAFAALLPYAPERVPVHFDARLNVDRWGSPTELWALVPGMLFTVGAIGLAAWSVGRQRTALPADAPEAAAALEYERRGALVQMCQAMAVSLVWVQAVFLVLLAASWLPGREALGDAAVAVMSVGSGVAAVGPLLAYLPRVRRATDALTAAGAPPATGTHPDGWKLGGLFYWAPDDPAIWVPKRIGIGTTVNFARPGAWAILALLLAPGLLAAGFAAMQGA